MSEIIVSDLIDYFSNRFLTNFLCYSPSLHLVSLPEYGFSSKILSAQKMKKKKFVPTTPAKRNVKNTHKYS